MRKVLFKKWINSEYDEKPYSRREGTGCFEPEFTNEGTFHSWGSDYEKFESGGCSFSVAIIELSNGEIVMVTPENIKFIN